MSKRVLIACEESGIVTAAMRNVGVEAWSCDILPTSGTLPEYHIQGDVLDILKNGWDAMIAFPPCTHLSVSGARWWPEKQADGRQQAAIRFFMALAKAPIERIAVENPVGIISTVWRKPDQCVQPWQFGHDASKRTCFWLKGFPLLKPTEIIIKDRYANQTPSGRNNLPPTLPDRARLRSKTYTGIARAMAEQWGPLLRGDK